MGADILYFPIGEFGCGHQLIGCKDCFEVLHCPGQMTLLGPQAVKWAFVVFLLCHIEERSVTIVPKTGVIFTLRITLALTYYPPVVPITGHLWQWVTHHPPQPNECRRPEDANDRNIQHVVLWPSLYLTVTN
jgi:hypothetical protein